MGITISRALTVWISGVLTLGVLGAAEIDRTNQERSATAYSLEDLDAFTRVERLSPRTVIVRNGVTDMDTVAAVATEKGVLVIDAGTNTPRTRRYRALIEKELGRRDFVYLIQTHFHRDHTYGNRAFPEATVVGHEQVAVELGKRRAEGYDQRELAESRERWQKELVALDGASRRAKQLRIYLYEADEILTAQAAGLQPWLPAISFNDRLRLDMGDLTVDLVYFGPAHTESDILVHIPQEKLLFVGDLFNAPGDINFDHFGPDLAPVWAQALDRVLSSPSDILYVINGHFHRTLDLAVLQDFRTGVQLFVDGYAAGREPYSVRGLGEIWERGGLEALVRELERLSGADGARYFFLENPLVTTAYGFLMNGKMDEARLVMELTCQRFPDSWNAFDSLGEVFMVSGDKGKAIENYEKSLILNPQNQNGAEQLKKLRERNEDH